MKPVNVCRRHLNSETNCCISSLPASRSELIAASRAAAASAAAICSNQLDIDRVVLDQRLLDVGNEPQRLACMGG